MNDLRMLLPAAICALVQPAMADEKTSLLTAEPYEIKNREGETLAGELFRLTVPETAATRIPTACSSLLYESLRQPRSRGLPSCCSPVALGAVEFRLLQTYLSEPFHLHHYGDVIAIDQRGVGLSEPNLFSPEGLFLIDLPLDAPLEREDYAEAQILASEECVAYWDDQGVDWRAYTTAASVEDIHAVRVALNEPQVVLHGASYGSHLGLAYLRKYPDTVARAFLSKVEGLGHTFKLPQHVQANLEKIHDLLQTEERWRSKVPDFLGLVESVLAQFDDGEIWFGGPRSQNRNRHRHCLKQIRPAVRHEHHARVCRWH